MFKNHGFALAEMLITLAIIGIVAALTIPSVIANSQQQEFKTGLKKAVSVLNSAITTSIALDGESPYDNADLFNYLTKHMSVMKTGQAGAFVGNTESGVGYSSLWKSDNVNLMSTSNAVFYTTDGMAFYIREDWVDPEHLKLHESDYSACIKIQTLAFRNNSPSWMEQYGSQTCGGCGSLGLKDNPNNTTKTPCAIMVDINGDKKPHPANINCKDEECAEKYNNYAKGFPGPMSKNLSDIFTILITEDRAIPYGVMAQRAMYGGK